jgi:hypothetical protein
VHVVRASDRRGGKEEGPTLLHMCVTTAAAGGSDTSAAQGRLQLAKHLLALGPVEGACCLHYNAALTRICIVTSVAVVLAVVQY